MQTLGRFLWGFSWMHEERFAILTPVFLSTRTKTYLPIIYAMQYNWLYVINVINYIALH